MKNLILIFLAFLSTFTFAQQEWCGTDHMLEEYFKANLGSRDAFFEEQDSLMSLPSVLKAARNSKAPIITIPVVVHVVHFNGTGNITKQQIDDGIRVLNEDFQKLNSDTSVTRAAFKSVAADSQIEFKLAKIDPDGNCTEGITRTSSFLTYEASNTVKALQYWPADEYFNIWLVNSIQSIGGLTTLGYAQFPGTGSLSTYGFVCVNREFGTIGSAAGSAGRTPTHEVGHNLNLLHTFQGSCGFFCTNSGDRVCDTPPAFGQTFGCTTTLNTCSNDAQGGNTANPNPYNSNVVDQIENYMSYDDCQNMFTEGQKDRMHASFSAYSFLNNLRSTANLIATGTNNGYIAPNCHPIAQIENTELKMVCTGGQLSFDEQSYQGAVTTYDWRFPGATPSTSSSATPTVTYNTPGYHDVTLIVSNASGADTLVVSDYVYVNDTIAAYGGFSYTEGFENISTIGNDWISISPSGNASWVRTTAGSYSGGASAFLDNFGNNSSNESDFLVSPSFDMTKVINPTFKFRLAYKSGTGANDVLKCAISLDCGQTWTTRFFASATSIRTGSSTGTFVPTSTADWRDYTVTTTAAIRASTNAIFRFDFKAGSTQGNNIFIDDFRIDGASSTVGIDDAAILESNLNLYPNPSLDGMVKLEFITENSVDNASIFLTDVTGKRVKDVYNGELNTDPYQFNISTEELSSGVYFLSIRTGNGNITKKLIVR